MDSCHKNLCVIPFIHLASRADGVVQLCCRSLKTLGEPSNNSLSLGKHSLNEIWNGAEMRKIRLLMLKGEKLPECQNCWNEEKNKKPSKRMRENQKFLPYSHSQLEEAKNNNGALLSNPCYIELKSGNLCNLKCRTCNPMASSLWQTELEFHKKKWDYIPSLKNSYQGSFNVSKQITKWHETNMFFQTIKKISQNLKYISITGGEPILIKSNELIIDHLIKAGVHKKITLRINSNMTRWNSSFFEKISQFKQVDFFSSIDAFGEKNNWIRSGSHFPDIEKNIKKLIQLPKNVKPHIICTISIYNILYVNELIKWSRYLAKKYNLSPPPIYFNILHQPKFQHISILTQSLKRYTINYYKNIINNNRIKLYKQEKEGINYIINSLQCSLKDTKEIIHLRALLKEHTETLDKWRGESFSAMFPELNELWH